MKKWKVPMPRKNPKTDQVHLVLAIKGSWGRLERTGEIGSTKADLILRLANLSDLSKLNAIEKLLES